MVIGVPKEIKTEEYRVGITPSGAADLRKLGHTVLIEAGAGDGSGFSDGDYLQVDADVIEKNALFAASELIVKVKEPLQPEYALLREGQALFTYLHLAPNRELTDLLLRKKITALGYETLEKDGVLPLLAPMSEIAGRMAPLMGAYFSQRIHGGNGTLSSGATGVRPCKTVILGAGSVGTNAARIAEGMGMDVVVMNRGIERLQRIDDLFRGRVKTLPLTGQSIREEIKDADIVICAVLVPGGKTPVLITRDMLKTMKQGCVIVDVPIDQGGCAETSRPTTHNAPIFETDGMIHYCVANMPGAYPRTSTLALTNATLPYIKILSKEGIQAAIRKAPEMRSAINTFGGHVVNRPLASALDLPYREFI